MAKTKIPAEIADRGVQYTAAEFADMLLEDNFKLQTDVNRALWECDSHEALQLTLIPAFQGGSHCFFKVEFRGQTYYCGFHDHHGTEIDGKWLCRMHRTD